jgi:hypothetical protein
VTGRAIASCEDQAALFRIAMPFEYGIGLLGEGRPRHRNQPGDARANRNYSKDEAAKPEGRANSAHEIASLGIKEVDDGIWLVSFMHYDLGYIDLEQRTLQTIDNPFGTRLSPMS